MIDYGDLKGIQRKITFKSLEVHPTEQALVVNCEIEASLLSNDFDDGFLEKIREIQKIIRLKSLDETTEIDAIVTQVISKSKGLLTEYQRDEIKQLILYLKNRQSIPNQTVTGAKLDSFRPKTAGARLSESQNGHSSGTNGLPNGKPLRGPSLSIDSVARDISRSISVGSLSDTEPCINNLEEYIELLYEDLPDKIKGAAIINELSSDHENLVLLIEKEPLICALSRLFREEGRKNLDLSILIAAIFANFSVFSQFHASIMKYKVGSSCIELIQAELEREMSMFKELALMQSSMNSEYRNASSSVGSSLNHSFLSSSSAPTQLTKQSTASLATEYEKSLRKYQTLITKQNLFFRAAFYLLLNLSEDKEIEVKMVNKGIVVLLVKVLERENWSDLLNIALLFLKKLSIYGENKDLMIHLGISGKLINILDNFQSYESSPHVLTALEVIHNLSFAQKFRHEVVGIGIIQRSLHLLNKTKFQHPLLEKLVYQIMYVLSTEEKIRVMFNMATSSNSSCISVLVSRFRKFLGIKKGCDFSELSALLINLATNQRNAKMICEKDNLNKFLAIATKGSSPMPENIFLLKLIRNIAQHEDDYKLTFVEFVPALVKILVSKEPTDFESRFQDDCNENFDDDTMILELLGITGSLNNVPGIKWMQICQNYNLWTWIEKRIQTKNDLVQCEDDLILESLIVVGTLCSQKDCCLYLLQQQLIKVLVDLLNIKQKEDEIVLQIIYIFHHLLKEDEIRKKVVKDDSQVIKYFLDLMNDNNTEIKRVCKQSLNILMDFEEDYVELVKSEKFKSYNQQWLEMISRESREASIEELDNDYLTDMNDVSYDFLIKSVPRLDDGFDEEAPIEKSIQKPISRPQTGYKTRPSSRISARSASHTSKPNNVIYL